MKCIQCGAESPEAAVFCGTCGAKLVRIEEKRKQMLQLEQELRELEEKKDKSESEYREFCRQLETVQKNVEYLRKEKSRMIEALSEEGEKV